MPKHNYGDKFTIDLYIIFFVFPVKIKPIEESCFLAIVEKINHVRNICSDMFITNMRTRSLRIFMYIMVIDKKKTHLSQREKLFSIQNCSSAFQYHFFRT